jgi:hypothetical protein
MQASSVPSIEELGAAGTEVIEFVPDPLVAREFNTTLMAMWRWDRDPALAALGWEPPVKIRGRNHRVRRTIEKFKQALIRNAIEERGRADSSR